MEGNPRTPDRLPRSNLLKGLLLWLVAGLALLSIAQLSSMEGRRKTIIYTAFLEHVRAGDIAEPLRIKEGYIYGTLRDGTKFITYSGDDRELFNILREHSVPFKPEPTSAVWTGLLISTVPVILLVLLFWFMINKQASSDGGRVMSFARSRPLLAGPKNKVTFADVAGSEESKEELREIIDFLKDPAKFQKLGGRIPRGVLLIGPPGTGKTLLAKAVAGEAGVPFLSMSGSDFVEMFVGVGAARVRDLFRQAKRMGPAIVFIDEIDAVGRQRFAGLGGGHDEREQTLNQLLVEMDGFQTDEAIIVMAATNRPDVLDPALTRPGRFDRTVVVNLPDIREREAILLVHARNKPMAAGVDFKVLARGTPGLSGADLANILNEASLLAARKNRSAVEMADLESAKDKVFMGAERRSLVISPDERRVIAFHEAGHTFVQKSLPDVYPVHKVTIIPRGQALGVTHILPERDRFIESDAYYRNTIATLLAGRATEQMFFGRLFTGSESDLKAATDIARKMVCAWGMSDKLGPVIFRQNDAVFLGRDIVQQKEHSEVTAREIDMEVRRILDDGERKAEEIIERGRGKVEALAAALLEKETLSSDDIDAILGPQQAQGEPNGREEDTAGRQDDPGSGG